MYVRCVDHNVEVMEELLTVIPMHGQTTAQEIFRQLCDAIADAGLPWKRFAGITTDGAPSMTGRRNGLVALVRRKLGEEGVEEAIALHCIIHQQALCSKCLKFDNVMSVVVKCINHIRSRGLKHRQLRMDVGTPFSGEKYADAIVKLQEEFDHSQDSSLGHAPCHTPRYLFWLQ
ncbi:hypothetical protein NHX12_016251 [Muraenolepis orangiensis]|uniref:Uncharacterized protein n=1 Tax=Muraenolepis orangiensis TaxID=630683 RepID=A0A9Q0I1R2_9TELE|nr:hypothetical protein NHX12_016251 [Muraenolepis orangiensis]